MKRISLLLVALSFVLASAAHADSTGVPYLDGSWQGKMTAKIYDQTIPGSNDTRFKYKSQVDVDIIQTVDSGDFVFAISFDTPLPTGTNEQTTLQTLGGNVGNFHMNVGADNLGIITAGSGAIDKKAKQIRMTGTIATPEYTIEFKLKVKHLND